MAYHQIILTLRSEETSICTQIYLFAHMEYRRLIVRASFYNVGPVGSARC